MNEALEAIERTSRAERPPRRGRDPRRVLVVLVLLAVAAGLVVAGIRAPRAGHPRSAPASSVRGPLGAARLPAIRALLRRRSAGIVHHDRAEFLSSVDPDAAGFRRQQSRVFANLALVGFASWSYRVAAAPAAPDSPSPGGAVTWSPARFSLHYRIAGFDSAPTDLTQYPTFVERSGRWYLASLSDVHPQGQVSATDLWDYAPVRVVRRPRVLVLGPPSERSVMIAVADRAEPAIRRVSAVWGRHWSRRVVIEVPSSQREMGLIAGDRGDLRHIAALTSAEVSAAHGRPEPVGDRITINPLAWPRLDPVGAAVVLTHELTHVATRADTGSQTPRWLAEGFADYVAFRPTHLPARSVAAELVPTVRAGRLPTALPANRDFNDSAARLPQAYELSWLACRYLASRYGQPALVRFYREVGRSRRDSPAAVSAALRRVFRLTPGGFTAGWRGYVRAQLAS